MYSNHYLASWIPSCRIGRRNILTTAKITDIHRGPFFLWDPAKPSAEWQGPCGWNCRVDAAHVNIHARRSCLGQIQKNILFEHCGTTQCCVKDRVCAYLGELLVTEVPCADNLAEMGIFAHAFSLTDLHPIPAEGCGKWETDLLRQAK
jgi:hypothetical protein